jgi:hypothetical protein
MAPVAADANLDTVKVGAFERIFSAPSMLKMVGA